MAESTWRPLNQTGRWGTIPVLVTAGNLASRTLRVKRDAGGGEEEIDAFHFQAHAEYTPDWMTFLAELHLHAAGGPR